MNKAERFIRIEDVMEILNVSRASAYRLAESGCFVAAKFGGSLRISLISVERYINSQIEQYQKNNGVSDD